MPIPPPSEVQKRAELNEQAMRIAELLRNSSTAKRVLEQLQDENIHIVDPQLEGICLGLDNKHGGLQIGTIAYELLRLAVQGKLAKTTIPMILGLESGQSLENTTA